MAKVTLLAGLQIGDACHVEAEIREATAGDLVDACIESERLLDTSQGPQLVTSPTLVGLNTLRRQIVRVGDHPGPLTLAELKKLSSLDLSLLQEEAQKLETAALREVAARGRD